MTRSASKTMKGRTHLRQFAEWEEWVASRPPVVQALCRRFPPNRKYWLDPPGQIVSLYSYAEDGTLTVDVNKEDNPTVWVSRRVFGILPDDLHELEAR